MAKAYGTGATPPKASKSSDAGGERSARIVNGVAMGKQDGKNSEKFHKGSADTVFYTHGRRSHQGS